MNFFQRYQRGISTILFAIFYLLCYYLVDLYVSTKGSFYTLQTPIDQIIPFIPAAVLLYLSIFVLAFLPYFAITNRKIYNKVIYTFFAITIFAFAIFILFPVQMLRPEIHAQTIFESMMTILYASELPFNCFPSLHVAVSFLSAFIVCKFKRKYALPVLIWAFLVSASIVFIKQHYFLDAVGGFLLAVIAYLFFDKVLMKSKS